MIIKTITNKQYTMEMFTSQINGHVTRQSKEHRDKTISIINKVIQHAAVQTTIYSYR